MSGRAQYFACVAALALVLGLGACSGAEDSEVQRISANGRGLALSGYDVMSYYRGDARVGLPDYRYDYEGVAFFFTSAVNREKFAQQPETFMPQYGGHCAFAMGFGQVVDPDPEAYSVVDGRLYLSASPMFRRFWQWFGDVEDADEHWRSLFQDPATG